ncbi:hypothetical protein H3V53_32890 [Paraburkholderia bengalensis]|uniref:Uncharacterized protein n=1 Tax=Paraburkholderia bengalensis TaxID=2747562 RepID=A0ABU8J1V6_9BURK
MADGSRWTVAELAEGLGVRKQNVWMALTGMQANGTVHIAGRRACPGGRRSERVFASGPPLNDMQEAQMESASWWPQADRVVIAAIDAMVRCR